MSAAPLSEPEARALADAITQVSNSQAPGEALKLIDTALARAPQQALVLNAAGGHMFKIGETRRARELFERAVASDPTAKVLWLNLAGAHRSLGDLQAALEALERALALEPRYVLALLQKGDVMERLGNAKAAAMAYQAALDSLASGSPAPQQAAAAVKHAQQVVQANNRELEAFLAREVQSVRQAHPGTDQRRYDACQSIMLGKRRAFASEPKQMLFPYLPAIEFFDRELFPWIERLEAATEDIAAEAVTVLGTDQAGFRPYVDAPAGTPLDQWAPLNRSMDWSVYSLWHDGKRIEDHVARCPKTAGLLAELPLCEVPGYAPGAFFSVLKPRTHLPAHTGSTNTRSIVHLPLVIPEGCRFRVGADERPWRLGHAWVFDDTIEHEAWNDSDQVRIILIFDIWNPLLSAAERDLVSALTVGLGRYYGADAPTLGTR